MPRRAGLLVSTAVCGALVLGTAGPAIAVVSDHSVSSEAAPGPIPDAEALTGQAKSLADTAGVLKPVADLVGAVLKAPDGKIAPDAAARLGKPVDEALATLAKPVPAPKAPAGAGLKVQAAADLQADITALLKILGAGDPKAITTAVKAVLTGSVNVLAAVLLGDGLPAPDLKGLPELPKIPGAATTPQAPGTTTLPAPIVPAESATPAE
ncbi:hypothetical protein [Streptomyces candidus]|uniref:Secreted protein n=1 Tax=Streptomyces candidus TaxID=67283 RepID=A0A7X0HIE1_9ACTN|nr:hypothetical protein [Streptomyces candidus]MBB6438201.1 hypothetical protein [Streptomyces candidus]